MKSVTAGKSRRGLLVGEVARLVGIHPETVKRLEKRGLVKSERDWNGWRRYSPEAVDTIRRLYRLDDWDREEGKKNEL